MTDEIELTPWEELRERIERGAPQPVADFLAQLGPAEMARAISRLSQADRSELLGLLDPSEAAELIYAA